MIPTIELKKGSLTKILRGALQGYYRGMPSGPGYVSAKWSEWEIGAHVVVYRAISGGRTVGWVVYNKEKSVIEDIVTAREWKGKGMEEAILDALLARENLVAAEVMGEDSEKYNRLIDYGFRPTRSFTYLGLPFTKMDLSTVVLFQRLAGKKPAVPYRKKEQVVIQRVPPSQSEAEIKESLKALLKNLGGLGRFVKPGQTVVIKPNIVSDHGLKDGVYKGGIVTDIRLIKALVEIILPIAGSVIIAEGSSINRSETKKMFYHYGYDRIVEIDPAKISILDLNNDDCLEKVVPGGKRMVSRKIPVTLDRAHVIINVPVLKIHFAAVASLSIKSLQGAVPPLEKYMTHFFGLWQNLVNIHHLVKPKLTIIDGLTGQEGFGPVSGTPKKMDILIGGTNPVALDAVAMRIMGLDPLISPPVWIAYMQGLGPIEPEKITITGPSIDEVKDAFQQPKIDISSGRDIMVHGDSACSGCKGYLHFVLSKLRRSDPKDPTRQLMDRPFQEKVHIYLGPVAEKEIDPSDRNILMGICQQHNAGKGTHLPGCPPHAEVIMGGIFGLFPDIERPKYADETEEAKLGKMLDEVLSKYL